MTTLMSKVANALSFAHLAGLGRPPAAAKAEDEELPGDPMGDAADGDPEDPKKKREDETADEYAKRMEAMDDEPGDDDKKKDDEKMAAAVAAAGAAGHAAGAKAERERCAAIFAAPAAAHNIALAAELAFTTDLAADRVVATLGKATPSALHNPARAARNPSVGAGAPALNPQAAMAARWDANLQAVKPKRRT